MQELEDLLDDDQKRAIKGKSLAAKTSEAFVLAASEHAAKRSVDLGMTILTGGLSQVLSLSDGVASFFKKD